MSQESPAQTRKELKSSHPYKGNFLAQEFRVWVGEMLYVSIRINNLDILKVNNSRDIYENYQNMTSGSANVA